jgi:hypothetical protein
MSCQGEVRDVGRLDGSAPARFSRRSRLISGFQRKVEEVRERDGRVVLLEDELGGKVTPRDGETKRDDFVESEGSVRKGAWGGLDVEQRRGGGRERIWSGR